MDADALERRRQAIVHEYGPWTAHNFSLGHDVYTMGSETPRALPDYPIGGSPDDIKLRRVLQVISDLSPKPLNELRVLDLGCLEGLYCVELGQRGAHVVGVEGRVANIEKARFAATVLELENVEFIHDDVRNLGPDRYGIFDIVLCLGLLYHLDAPDVFGLIEAMASVCSGMAIIDTHVSLRPYERRAHRGADYWGKPVPERELVGETGDSLWPLWRGIGNTSSFVLTRPSLMNAVRRAGFTSAFECHIPPEPGKERDRTTLVSLRGDDLKPMSTPARAGLESYGDMPEASLTLRGRLWRSRLGKRTRGVVNDLRRLLRYRSRA